MKLSEALKSGPRARFGFGGGFTFGQSAGVKLIDFGQNSATSKKSWSNSKKERQKTEVKTIWISVRIRNTIWKLKQQGYRVFDRTAIW